MSHQGFHPNGQYHPGPHGHGPQPGRPGYPQPGFAPGPQHGGYGQAMQLHAPGVNQQFLNQNYLKPINQVYAYIPEGFNHVGNAFLDAATNDGISTIIDSDIHKLSRGYVTSSNPIEECWNKSYK